MEGGKKWLIAVWAVTIVVILGGVGLYFLQISQANELRTQLTSIAQQQSASIEQLSSQISELKTQQTAVQSTTVSSSGIIDDDSMLSFTNIKGGYSFKYSRDWKVFVNAFDNSRSLFGPTASDSVGLGGVEVYSFAGNLNDWLKYLEQNTEIRFIDSSFTKISGRDAVRVTHKSMNRYSSAVYIKQGAVVYNIYVGSRDSADLARFEQIVNSFVLLK